MKQVEKEVKSKGKVLSTIRVPQYETIKEASDAQGAEKCLNMINKAVSDAATNAERTAKTRGTSPNAQLARMAKDNPNVQAEIEKLIAKYNR